MNSIQFLIYTAIGFYVSILILRAWFQYCKVDYYHRISQVLLQLTQPVLSPLRNFIKIKSNNIDIVAILAAVMFCALKFPLLNLVGQVIDLNLLNILLLGVLGVLKTFGEIIFAIIIIRAVMSWFSQGRNNFDYILYQLSEPLLAPIRRLLPQVGMIDFSVMALGFLLIFANKLLYDLFGELWAVA